MATKKKTSSNNRKGCWCGGPESDLEIECSNCRSWIHYLCSGITLPELNAAVHENPGLYLCKTCINSPKAKEICSRLISIHDCDIHQYNSQIHTLMNLDAPSLIAINKPAATLDEIQSVRETTSELKEILAQMKSTTSYSQAAACNITSQSRIIRSPAPTGGTPTQRRPVEPKHTFIIEKINTPNQYKDSLSLQNKIRSCDASLMPLINNAKVVSNGNLLIEAKEESALPDLSNKLNTVLHHLGPEATLRPMVKQGPSTKSAIAFNVPASYTKDTIIQHAKIEFPSTTDVLDLKKPNSTPTRRPIKISLTDASEFQRLLNHGLKIGWEIYSADEWLPGPLQCFKCQRFGHTANVCHSKQRCINCGGDHPKEGRCNQPTRCCNCQGNHLASNKKCPTRKDALMQNATTRLLTQHHG